ncbi:hypothetical protein F5J12DRAFT_861117 [Pisolithus orientalis]|uniref:uncharacterized protein n=1 Tax=Pisolithus orientalis TaxID=936130 RepID=UPI0022240445|nr:uncharacterized protein F5J12DRAFT_861117 [Pisolithus orientalis]KAI5991739.1 hypothetical protein F5J12DRAFT_861117 [Pisolithus orientalis]
MAPAVNGDTSGGQTLGKVNVNDRALVDKVLARYPREFTVFRELIQNADDAQAEEVQIEFQTEQYITAVGGTGHVDHLNTIQVGSQMQESSLSGVKLARWVLRNDGDPFTVKDWERITNIADGNPDERKIGAFGVGFFSVFSVTDSPVIISGGIRKRMFYENNELLVESRSYANRDSRDWTTFEMDLKSEADLTMPKPFDLSRFISTAMTFLVKVKNVTVLFNGSSRTEATKIEIPQGLKTTSPSNAFEVTFVKAFDQQVTVNINGQAYGAGSNTRSSRKKGKPHVDPVLKSGFFLGKRSSESNGHHILPETSAKDFSLSYKVYSAEVCTGLSHRMARGIEKATKKKPPKTFLFEAVHFTLSEYESVQREHDHMRGLNSVFMGPQGLLSERDGLIACKGQTTTETTGIAVHLSSRFIPTVERGSIDLANGQVREWNEELLYIGGFMARLIYERGMSVIRHEWSSRPDQARKEGLFLMKSFAFRSSSDSNVAGLLQKAFFDCTPNLPFPIVSNLGIRDSKDVRKPDETFATFMKQRPVLDLVPETESMIVTLPKWYKVSDYTFRDIVDELNQRVFTEEDMVAFITWWVKICLARWGDDIADGGEEVKKQFNQASKSDVTLLNDIRKFVDGKGWGSYIRVEDPLPPDTIPISFTSRLNALAVRTVLGWEELTIVDWIQHVVGPRLNPDYKRVLEILQSLWPSLKLPEKEKIISLLQNVDCILTSDGLIKPSEAYFPEADLFNDLPVIRPTDFNEQMLQEFGVKMFIPWSGIKGRLPHPRCTPYQLAVYFDRVHDVMTTEDRMELQQMAIFTGADGGFHYLEPYPPLDVIIRKASSEENTMRKYAFAFLLDNMNSVYSNYDPADFQGIAFIPCGKWNHLQLGTPEQVFISSEWELLGFKRLHPSVNKDQTACLKIKDRPPASAIVKVLREKPPKDNKEAQSWFDLLARKGGFTADELKDIAELSIVPSHTGSDAGSLKWVQPRKCFLEKPDDSNEHYRQLFNFVMFNPTASSFLRLCGAKPKPDYSDISEALLQDPQGYLAKAKPQKYLDDLRQVARPELKMRNAEIFLGYRRKRGPDTSRSAESIQYALRRAREILIADDMESYRLFGEYVLVAPKEEVFDNFYRAMGSANLSVHVSHTIETEGKGGEDKDLRSHVLCRVKIFLWQNPEHFSVKHCERLRITKRLDFENALEGACSTLTTTTRGGNHILWVANNRSGSRRAWYDMSVALCRLLFRTRKAHDTSSLMTILDASLEDLHLRGYDVSWIEDNPVRPSDNLFSTFQALPLPLPLPAPPPSPDPPQPRLPLWIKDFRHLMGRLFTRRKTPRGRFLSAEMEQLMDEALKLCERDDGNRDRTIHQNTEDPKRGKKQHDVKYCSASRVMDLKYCRRTRDGMAVFKTSKSNDPPEEELEAFSGVLRNLAQMFHLEPTQLHVFWQSDDAELMGFNRNHAIYLNLAHFMVKHLGKYSSDDHGKADVYSAWFLIIAHEIAHNKAFWHDEDHELLFTYHCSD